MNRFCVLVAATGAAVTAAAPAIAGNYVFTPIVVANATTAGTRVNDHNQVVGQVTDTASQMVRGFVDSAGSLQYFNAPAGGLLATMVGIDNHGLVVATFGTRHHHAGGFTYNSHTGRSKILTVPGAVDLTPYAVNNSGQVVGAYSNTTRHYPYGFLVSGGVGTTIDPPGSIYPLALGIDDADTVAGYYSLADNTIHGYTYAGGTYTSFDVPGSTLTEVTTIDANGAVTGIYTDAGNVTHGYTKVGNHYTTYDFPGAFSGGTTPLSVFAQGQTIGRWTGGA